MRDGLLLAWSPRRLRVRRVFLHQDSRPTIDDEDVTIDEGGGGGGEEDRGAGDLVGAAPAPQGRALLEIRADLGIGREMGVGLGREEAGGDGVAGDAMSAILGG